ncbi:MAG: exosome complex protein Rrp42 [Candidatus Wukongarchaeota archaeon]|nr:exosome complex protein Rrp42 [Candidatus Wukongarchaeota archaeon]
MVGLSEVTSAIEREHISSLLVHGKRIDDRGLFEFRNIEVEVSPIEKAEGSAQVVLGGTKVVAGVKVDVGPPFSDTPNKGVLTCNAELTPIASPFFESGPPDEQTVELARVVDRGIRESKAVDLEKLVLIPGEKVRVCFVDVYVLDYDGNLFDASEIAASVALMAAKVPEVEVNEDTGEITVLDKKQLLPISNIPVSATFAKIDGVLVLDPCLKEERVQDARITMTSTQEGNICAFQKGGIGTITLEDVDTVIEVVKEKAEPVRDLIRELTKEVRGEI